MKITTSILEAVKPVLALILFALPANVFSQHSGSDGRIYTDRIDPPLTTLRQESAERAAKARAQAREDKAEARRLEEQKQVRLEARRVENEKRVRLEKEAEISRNNTEAKNLTMKALKTSKDFLSEPPNDNGYGGGPDEGRRPSRSNGSKRDNEGFLTELVPNDNGYGGSPDEGRRPRLGKAPKVDNEGLLTESNANNNSDGSSGEGQKGLRSSNVNPQNSTSDNPSASKANTLEPPAPIGSSKVPPFVSNSQFDNQYEAWRNSAEGTSERLRNVPTTESTQPYLRKDGTITTVGEEARKGDAQFLNDINSPRAPKPDPTSSP